MNKAVTLGALAVTALIAGCGSGHVTGIESSVARTQGVSLGSSKGVRSIPAWAQKCLPKGAKRVGSAPKYISLTPAAAVRLDRHRNDLVFAGGGGRCGSFQDDVYRSHPIAVVYNLWNIHRPDARIIAAVRAAPGWQPGD
jgi:hypothetical protein